MFECIAFCSGALVMILEMIGARVMAPYLGTSTIVWTSLIGTVLACLALGAWIGGRLADKKLSPQILGFILLGAAGGSLITAMFHNAVGAFIVKAVPNLYLAAVLAALALLALPATCFGMVSPYIIRLRIGSVQTSGATVGRLYALSTAGSIIGTFLGGFVLVTFFSSTQILLGTAFGMIILAFFAFGRKKQGIACMVFTALLGCGFAYGEWHLREKSEELPQTLDTRYNLLTFFEGLDKGRPVRMMGTDPGYMQSGMFKDDPAELYFDYTQVYALAPMLLPQASRILMLGGGAYSVPKWLLAGKSALQNTDFQLDVVELDPGITRAAQRYFNVPDDSRMRIFHEDARFFLNKNTSQYDIVFVDVFNSHYSVPFHIGTKEAAERLHAALAPEGMMMMNIISAIDGADGKLFRSIYHAMRSVFDNVTILAVSNPYDLREVQNIMLIAFANTSQTLDTLQADETLPTRLKTLLATPVTKDIAKDVPALEDDFAPVEYYALPLSQRS